MTLSPAGGLFRTKTVVVTLRASALGGRCGHAHASNRGGAWGGRCDQEFVLQDRFLVPVHPQDAPAPPISPKLVIVEEAEDEAAQGTPGHAPIARMRSASTLSRMSTVTSASFRSGSVLSRMSSVSLSRMSSVSATSHGKSQMLHPAPLYQPFPRVKIHTRVIYGFLLWAAMNAATPLREKSILGVIY